MKETFDMILEGLAAKEQITLEQVYSRIEEWVSEVYQKLSSEESYSDFLSSTNCPEPQLVIQHLMHRLCNTYPSYLV